MRGVGMLMLLAAGAAVFVPGGKDSEAAPVQQDESAGIAVTFSLPARVDPRRVGVGAAGELHIGRQAKLVAENRTWAPLVTNVGSKVTDIGPGASVGTVVALDRVVVGEQATLNGDAISQAAVELAGKPTVVGQILQQQPPEPGAAGSARFGWKAKLGAPSTEPVRVASRQTRTLPGGSYGDVEVESGAKLTLSGARQFRFRSLHVHAGGILEVAAGERTELYLDDVATFRGAITTPNASTPPPLTIVALGSGPSVFESSLRALLIAPRGKVILGGLDRVFHGAVFARDAELRPDVELHHLEFDLRPAP